jgi:hypothetical protein
VPAPTSSRRCPLARWLVGAAAILAAAAPAASARTEVARSGGVTASLSYDYDQSSYQWSDLWLTIRRGGEVAHEASPTLAKCEEPYCAPAGGGRKASIRASDLDGDGEPEVVVGLYWGGAHCCFLARVYRFDGERYHPVTHNFGDGGYRLTDVGAGGRLEFLSSDWRFGYRYASFAYSVFPVQVWTFTDGRFSDITERFRGRIARDSRRAWRIYRRVARGDGEVRGALAAWAADEYRLGRRAQARAKLRVLADHGALGGYGSPVGFIHRLDMFLRRRGYDPAVG